MILIKGPTSRAFSPYFLYQILRSNFSRAHFR
nr:MAG TPA: hypothetical protein [Caudoviricetes sp.]